MRGGALALVRMGAYLVRMDRTAPAEQVRNHVTAAITAAGVTVPILSEATDIPSDILNSRLNGHTEFLMTELEAVGGFFHVNPASFLEGIR